MNEREILKKLEEEIAQNRVKNLKSQSFEEMLQSHREFKRPFQIKLICLFLCIMTFTNLVLILTFYREGGVPWIFSMYYNSLLVINLIAIFGLWYLEKWSWYLVLYIAVSQILTQLYVLISYFQMNQSLSRILDIAFGLYIVYYFTRSETRSLFFRDIRDSFYVRQD